MNRGPLERAQEHIRRLHLGEYIETRLSDGLSALAPGEADSMAAAGMGGPLMQRILEEGREALSGMKELILQPQSEISAFRRWLLQNGYRIAAENMVLEEGKYYVVMRAVPGSAGSGTCHILWVWKRSSGSGSSCFKEVSGSGGEDASGSAGEPGKGGDREGTGAAGRGEKGTGGSKGGEGL